MDEYTTAKILTTNLNLMCDGNFPYPNKNGDAVQKKMTIIICGNKHPEVMYPKSFQFISARFTVIEVKEGGAAVHQNFY